MQAQLRPGPRFEQLVHGADAAGQCEERVREIAHQELALRHRAHDVQLRQARVPDFAIDQQLRNHADHASSGRQSGVGQRPHQPHASAAVHQSEAAARDQCAGRRRQRGIRWTVAGAGAAKHTQGFHEGILTEVQQCCTGESRGIEK
jgi:hypothetical protein